MILEAIIGLLIGAIATFAFSMLLHSGMEYGKREGIIAKKKEDRDE